MGVGGGGCVGWWGGENSGKTFAYVSLRYRKCCVGVHGDSGSGLGWGGGHGTKN